MALSGVIYGSTNNKYVSCYISWSATQNKIENYSDVTAILHYFRTNTGYTTKGTWSGAIGIDGNVGTGSRYITVTYDSYTWALTHTARVYHNNEGKKSLYINASGGIPGTSFTSTYCGATVTLDDIPRVSTLSATNVNVGENPVISIGKADKNYTDTITYTFGNLTGTIATDSLDSQITDWKIPDTFYAEMIDSASKDCTLTTTTKNGEITLGTNTATFTVSVDPEICSPVLTPTVTDTNDTTIALTGSNTTLIKYYSTAHCVSNAQSLHDATITTQTVNQIVNDGILDIPNVQTGEFLFTVIDSRGLVTSKTIARSFIDYLNLTSSISVTIPTTDGEVTLKTSGLYYNSTFGAVDNEIIAKYRYKEGSTWKDWIPFTPTLTDNTYAATINITGLDYRQPYQFQVSVSDKLSTAESTSQVVRAIPLFDWDDKSFNFHIPPKMDDNPLVIGDAKGNVPITNGGTGAITAESARTNLDVLARPKLLWSGSFSSGSITVPDFSKYELFMIRVYSSLQLASVDSGYLSVGQYAIDASAAGWGTLASCVMSINGDTLTMAHNLYVSNQGTNWYASQADSPAISISRIYGLVLKDEL